VRSSHLDRALNPTGGCLWSRVPHKLPRGGDVMFVRHRHVQEKPVKGIVLQRYHFHHREKVSSAGLAQIYVLGLVLAMDVQLIQRNRLLRVTQYGVAGATDCTKPAREVLVDSTSQTLHGRQLDIFQKSSTGIPHSICPPHVLL
jgi:hypothetical protein